MNSGLHTSTNFLAHMILVGLIATVFGFTNVTDQHALITFKDQIQVDPFNVFNSWNTSIHFCYWHGIRCNDLRHQRVTVVNLSSLELVGSLSPYVANLTFLEALILSNNSFYGSIPQEIRRLYRLQSLVLYNNSFQGEFPSNLTHSTNIQLLDVGKNNIGGHIPTVLSCLSNLLELHLSANHFVGMIPPSLGNLSALRTLSLSENNLEGSIPDEFGLLSNLHFLELSSNNLSGTVPPSVYNLSSVQYFLLASNRLRGSFPPHVGFTLPNLHKIYVRRNQFTGYIPPSLANASQLEQLDIGINSFSGAIPSDLENLQNLRVLNFDGNLLGGVLPVSITNLSRRLISLRLNQNLISGTIPEGVGNLVNLENLALSENMFTGRIPDSIGKLTKLQGIDISKNKFYGGIPSSISNITLLSILSMRENLLQGTIPSSLSNCTYLQELDLSHNQLTGAIPRNILSISSLSLSLSLAWNRLSGPLPAELGSLGNLGRLDISNNQLSGELPPTFGGLASLEFLYIQGNHFEGTIPSSLGSIKGIQVLDLSCNNFSGRIPLFLANYYFIWYLNLSFNRFEGEVPNIGVFSNSSSFSVLENESLCGGVKSLELPSCSKYGSAKRRKLSRYKVVIIVVGSILFMVLMASVCALYLWTKFPKLCFPKFPKLQCLELNYNANVVPRETELGDMYPKLSYAQLLQATEVFSQANTIAKGRYSSVYKGTLSTKQTVAVKVLNLQQHGAKKSFVAECQAMRNIRHRNIVKTVTACSGIDFQGRDFKALVYEFMSNGSLESWIHPNTQKYLSLTQRLNIAIDVASALHYLHNCCETPIIHQDLKPSNILLDAEFHAHISDFGLARSLLASTERSKRVRSIGIAGTVGYIALEYGIGGPVSTLVDVYSFGILLLEMFTGKRPTDSGFKDNYSLHNYVNMSLPGQVMTIVDPVLISEAERKSVRSNDHSSTGISIRIQECLASILRVGIICSSQSPKDRIDAANVLMQLNAIRNNFSGQISTHQSRPHPNVVSG